MSFPRRIGIEEQMDSADLDPGVYARVLADLAKANRVTLAARPTLGFLARAAAGRDRLAILDVGFGAGDMLRRIARWAQARGLSVRLVGVDLNPQSAAVAASLTPTGLPIEWRTGDYRDQPDRFDVVLSSLVAHHMSEGELIGFLRFMEAEATRGWFVNDLHRSRFSWLGYPLLARLAGWHRIVREDGTLSIARSFRRADWLALLAQAGVEGARVRRIFPGRLCVDRLR